MTDIIRKRKSWIIVVVVLVLAVAALFRGAVGHIKKNARRQQNAAALQKEENAAPVDPEKAIKWERILAFDILDSKTNHKADIGANKMVVAELQPGLGWEICVYNYPISDKSDNLLYGGLNLHGIQPWMVFAWTKERKVYPDERIVSYDSGKCRLKIVLVDCKVKEVDDKPLFTGGRIEIFHLLPSVPSDF